MKKLIYSLLLAITVSACAQNQETKPEPTNTESSAPVESSVPDVAEQPAGTQTTVSDEDVKSTYRFGSGDLVDIQVFGEPDMSMKVKLDSNGAINYPYIGNLVLKDRTPVEIETEIEDKLRGDYLLNPMVTVSIAGFRDFFVLGEVMVPNGYEYQPGMTVQKAIAMAGGFTDRSSNDINVRLSNSEEVLEDVELTFPINPGDTIIVEQSFF